MRVRIIWRLKYFPRPIGFFDVTATCSFAKFENPQFHLTGLRGGLCSEGVHIEKPYRA